MAKVVNLRAARKGKARAAARVKADENAAKFGRSAAQKAREAADVGRASADLDGKKRDRQD